MVGRWIVHLRHGQFVQRSIGDAAAVRGEKALGWAVHYLIGLLYGVGYLWLVGKVWGHTPTLVSATVFSVVLLLPPWFILLPGLGLGIFACRAPKPWLLRGTSLCVHVVFGIGMYLGWRLLGLWIQ